MAAVTQEDMNRILKARKREENANRDEALEATLRGALAAFEALGADYSDKRNALMNVLEEDYDWERYPNG